jgi:hypothetical protein
MIAQLNIEPLTIDIKTILMIAISAFAYYVRREGAIRSLSDKAHLEKEIRKSGEAIEERRIASSYRTHEKIDHIESKFNLLSKVDSDINARIDLEISKINSALDKEISLLSQTTETMTGRLVTIEEQIKDLSGKMDSQMKTIIEEIRKR